LKDKDQHIDYWLTSAKEDMETVDYLFSGGRFIHALFFIHLAMEKVLKAHWVKASEENIPPKTHNLIYLVEKSNLNLSEGDTDFLQKLNAYQIEGRYPDYLSKLRMDTMKETAGKIRTDAKILFQCLTEILP
jgi:HEPN domain-containing protein